MSESIAVSAVRVAVVQFDPQTGTHNSQNNLQNSLDLALQPLNITLASLEEA